MPGTSLPQYDELYVISDIHMGGQTGFQILKDGKRLGNFIRWVSQQRPGEQVALVLNGDVFDSLAENINGYIAADDAVAMITRIFNDQSFVPIWEALKDFVGIAGRSLVFVIGNHDIEVALPGVQRAIEKRLAGDEAAARGRIFFSSSGAGYSCTVGNARIFCTHGNEKDSWNLVDYEALFKLAREQNAGLPFDSKHWEPNAGTMMVRDIMNEIKRRYAWIDLLKPERKAAIGVLVVLDPGQINKISRGIPILWEKLRRTLKSSGLLSADEMTLIDADKAQNVTLNELLGENLLGCLTGERKDSGISADNMLLQAEEALNKPAGRASGADGTLGWGQLTWDMLTGVKKPEALRKALMDWLQKDTTFDIKDRDDTFTEVTAKVGPDIDFIITGHTHLERAIELDARRCYFNCGTWIRLLSFTNEILNKPDVFQKIYDVLMNGRMDEIDQAEIAPGQPFVMNQTSAVSIRSEGGEVVGELIHVEDGDPIKTNVVSKFRRR